MIAAQVREHTRVFFHDPNLGRLPDGRIVIAAPQWGSARTPDAGTRHLRVLASDDGGTTWAEAPALPYEEGRPFVLDGRLLMFVQEEVHRDFLLVGSDDGGRSWSEPARVLCGPLWNISTAMLERDGELLWAMDYDLPAGMYWMLGNLVTNSRDYLGWGERVEQARYRRAAGERRWLFLHHSIDCLRWFPAGCVARWSDDVHRSFMYPSAVVDGDDLVLLSRTSRDSRDQHDADLCTIHRVRDFRSLAMDLHAGGLHRTATMDGTPVR